MINIKDILIGLALVLIFSIILGLLFGSFGSYIGFIVGTMTYSYLSRINIEKGALNGALSAMGAGIIFYLSMLLMGIALKMGPGLSMIEMGWQSLIIGIMVDGIIGAVGGAIGSLIYYYRRVAI